MKKSAYTQEEFINKVMCVNPTIAVVGIFTGVENKINISCKHQGVNSVFAYTLLKPRNCCRKGYFENRKMYNIKDIDTRKKELLEIFGDCLDVSNAALNDSRDKILNLRCTKHNSIFSQWISSLNAGIGCHDCGKENKSLAGLKMITIARKVALGKGKAKYVSKSETKWLDSMGVPIRQKWLDDVKYNVDGFDPDTNTVYLYHGEFWHGCPIKFDPEMIHPILKVKMKQLYEQTLLYESKIKDAGYNLVVKWGK